MDGDRVAAELEEFKRVRRTRQMAAAALAACLIVAAAAWLALH